MTSINFISTSRITTSTIQGYEVKLYDFITASNIPITMSNGVLQVDNKPVQGGGGSFPSSLSTYQIFASTIQISPPTLYDFTAQFNLDVTGTAHITEYLSVGSLYTGAQYIGLQFG